MRTTATGNGQKRGLRNAGTVLAATFLLGAALLTVGNARAGQGNTGQVTVSATILGTMGISRADRFGSDGNSIRATKDAVSITPLRDTLPTGASAFAGPAVASGFLVKGLATRGSYSINIQENGGASLTVPDPAATAGGSGTLPITNSLTVRTAAHSSAMVVVETAGSQSSLTFLF